LLVYARALADRGRRDDAARARFVAAGFATASAKQRVCTVQGYYYV
jgi:hypothetical protein